MSETNAAFERVFKHSTTFKNVSHTCTMTKQKLKAREKLEKFASKLKSILILPDRKKEAGGV